MSSEPKPGSVGRGPYTGDDCVACGRNRVEPFEDGGPLGEYVLRCDKCESVWSPRVQQVFAAGAASATRWTYCDDGLPEESGYEWLVAQTGCEEVRSAWFEFDDDGEGYWCGEWVDGSSVYAWAPQPELPELPEVRE